MHQHTLFQEPLLHSSTNHVQSFVKNLYVSFEDGQFVYQPCIGVNDQYGPCRTLIVKVNRPKRETYRVASRFLLEEYIDIYRLVIRKIPYYMRDPQYKSHCFREKKARVDFPPSRIHRPYQNRLSNFFDLAFLHLHSKSTFQRGGRRYYARGSRH